MQQAGYNSSTLHVQRTCARLGRTFPWFAFLDPRPDTPAGACTVQDIGAAKADAAFIEEGAVSV